MTIKERLEKLKQDNFYVEHKALGKTQMIKDYDLVRIRRNGTIQGVAVSDKVIEDFNKDLLDRDIRKEEVWSLGGQELALDLFIS